MENQTLDQGLAAIINEAAPGAVEVPAGTEPAPQDQPTQTVIVESTPQTTVPETQPTTTETNGMKQLRNQYDTVKREHEQDRQLLQRVADSMGIPIEQLAEKMQAEEDKKKATANNVPVEIQRQIREQQEQIRRLEMENLRANYDSRAAKLRAEYNLNDVQMIEFAEKAKNAGFNVFTPGLDLNMLYRSMNYDSIISNLREQIRQEVLTELQGKPTNTINNMTPNPASNTNSDMSAQDFMNQLFNSVR